MDAVPLDEYGIKVNYKWTVPSDQFSEKRSLMLSTGDIPDFFYLDSTGFEQAVASDMLYDLSEVYEEYASDALKERMNIDANTLTAGTVDGKLYALPQAGDQLTNDIMVLWIRQDWLDNLGLEVPTTVDEMIAVAEAFKNNDPDGNGEDDTVGIGFSYNSGLCYKGLLYAMGAYPDIWLEDESGSLVSGTIQPEMKTALEKVQEIYKKGLIETEFYVKNYANYQEDLGSGRIGMTIDNYVTPLSFSGSWDVDKNANWICCPLPGATEADYPAVSAIGNSYTQYWVVSKDCEHPEAMIQIMNHFVDKQTNDYSFIYDSENRSIWEYTPATMHTPNNNLINQRAIAEALDKGSSDGLPVQAVSNYDSVMNHQNGSTDPTEYALTLIFGKESGLAMIDETYITPGKYVQDAFYGASTETMVKASATLSDLELQVFTNIVLGESADAFDTFVEDWKATGGEQITTEVNEWYESNKN